MQDYNNVYFVLWFAISAILIGMSVQINNYRNKSIFYGTTLVACCRLKIDLLIFTGILEKEESIIYIGILLILNCILIKLVIYHMQKYTETLAIVMLCVLIAMLSADIQHFYNQKQYIFVHI